MGCAQSRGPKVERSPITGKTIGDGAAEPASVQAQVPTHADGMLEAEGAVGSLERFEFRVAARGEKQEQAAVRRELHEREAKQEAETKLAAKQAALAKAEAALAARREAAAANPKLSLAAKRREQAALDTQARMVTKHMDQMGAAELARESAMAAKISAAAMDSKLSTAASKREAALLAKQARDVTKHMEHMGAAEYARESAMAAKVSAASMEPKLGKAAAKRAEAEVKQLARKQAQLEAAEAVTQAKLAEGLAKREAAAALKQARTDAAAANRAAAEQVKAAKLAASAAKQAAAEKLKAAKAQATAAKQRQAAAKRETAAFMKECKKADERKAAKREAQDLETKLAAQAAGVGPVPLLALGEVAPAAPGILAGRKGKVQLSALPPLYHPASEKGRAEARMDAPVAEMDGLMIAGKAVSPTQQRFEARVQQGFEDSYTALESNWDASALTPKMAAEMAEMAVLELQQAKELAQLELEVQLLRADNEVLEISLDRKAAAIAADNCADPVEKVARLAEAGALADAERRTAAAKAELECALASLMDDTDECDTWEMAAPQRLPPPPRGPSPRERPSPTFSHESAISRASRFGPPSPHEKYVLRGWYRMVAQQACPPVLMVLGPGTAVRPRSSQRSRCATRLPPATSTVPSARRRLSRPLHRVTSTRPASWQAPRCPRWPASPAGQPRRRWSSRSARRRCWPSSSGPDRNAGTDATHH